MKPQLDQHDRALVAAARAYGLDVEEERADLATLRGTVAKLGRTSPELRPAVVRDLNEGAPPIWRERLRPGERVNPATGEVEYSAANL